MFILTLPLPIIVANKSYEYRCKLYDRLIGFNSDANIFTIVIKKLCDTCKHRFCVTRKRYSLSKLQFALYECSNYYQVNCYHALVCVELRATDRILNFVNPILSDCFFCLSHDGSYSLSLLNNVTRVNFVHQRK